MERQHPTSSAAASDSHRIDKLENVLRGEVDALRNDLHQAQALASEYQRQLSDKANDMAALRHSLERALGDLEKLHVTVAQLRSERQALSEEALRALVLERRLALVSARLEYLERQQQQAATADENLSGKANGGAVPEAEVQEERKSAPALPVIRQPLQTDTDRIEISFSKEAAASVVIMPESPVPQTRGIYRK